MSAADEVRTPYPDCASKDRPHGPHQLAGPGGNKPGAWCDGLSEPAADEALQECSVCHGSYPYPVELNHDEAECDTFLAGYRRALEDAAEKWHDPEFRRKQPVLAYIGLDIAVRDLAADREAFDREVARKGAEAFGAQAAADPRETKD